MLTQSQLKTLFTKYDFAPLKRLGQNYLIDANIKDKIIAAAGISRDDVVLEIGPGLGALTFDLAASGATVFAVEKDRKASAILGKLAGQDFPNLKIFHEDILDFDIAAISGGKKITVVGNLPYYITTPIIERIIDNASLIRSALVLVQREFADRLMANAGSKNYSSLSCFVQYHMRPIYLFTIKSSSFYPAPDVDSSLVRLEMLDAPSVKVRDETTLFKVIRSSFNQRRKTIGNSLSRELALNLPKTELSAILKSIHIDPAARPETLSLADFAKISDAVTL